MSDPLWCSEKVKYLDYYKTVWSDIRDHELTWRHRDVAERIADIYVTSENFDTFSYFLSTCNEPTLRYLLTSEKFNTNVIRLKIREGLLKEARDLIETGKFSPNNYQTVIDLWDSIHYQETHQLIRKPLTPLIRYRVRKRNPPPKSICPSGIRSSYKLSETAKTILNTWLSNNSDHPYPSKFDRDSLSEQTELSTSQIKTWFANRRRRLRVTSPQKENVNGSVSSSIPEHDLQHSDRQSLTLETAKKYARKHILNDKPCFMNHIGGVSMPTHESPTRPALSHFPSSVDELSGPGSPQYLHNNPHPSYKNTKLNSFETTFTVLEKHPSLPQFSNNVNIINSTHGHFDWMSPWKWQMLNPPTSRFLPSSLPGLSHDDYTQFNTQSLYSLPRRPENYGSNVHNMNSRRTYVVHDRLNDSQDFAVLPSQPYSNSIAKDDGSPSVSAGSIPQPTIWRPHSDVLTYPTSIGSADERVISDCDQEHNFCPNYPERRILRHEDEEAAEVLLNLSSRDYYTSTNFIRL